MDTITKRRKYCLASLLADGFKLGQERKIRPEIMCCFPPTDCYYYFNGPAFLYPAAAMVRVDKPYFAAAAMGIYA